MIGVLTAVGHGVGLALWVVSLAVLLFGLRQSRSLPSALVLPGAVAVLPLAFLFRGIFGDVSFSLPWLCALAAGVIPSPPHRRRVLFFFASCGLLLNVSALGFVELDVYSLGYSATTGTWILAGLGLAATLASPILALTWCVGLWLMLAGLTPTSNAFDLAWDMPAILLSLVLLSKKQLSSA